MCKLLLQTVTLPEDWLIADVILIYKKDSWENLGNKTDQQDWLSKHVRWGE